MVEAWQLKLFKDRKYVYHVLVTNLKSYLWRVWRFYAQHVTIEKNVRELLYDYSLGKISTDDWVANVEFFQLLLFAYNLCIGSRGSVCRGIILATLDTLHDFWFACKLAKRRVKVLVLRAILRELRG